MKESNRPYSTRNATSNPAGSNNKGAKQHTTNHHSTHVNPPSKKGKRTCKTRPAAASSKRDWAVLRDDPNRYEIDKLLKNFVSTHEVPRTGSVPEYVNELYRAAMKENPVKLVLLFAGKRVLHEYFEAHPQAYSGFNPFFTEQGLEGGAAKVNLTLAVVETMTDEYVLWKNGETRPNTLWLGGFDANLGGAVKFMETKVNLAIKRGYKEEYDRETGKIKHFDRNIISARGTSLNDEESAVFLSEAAFATEADPMGDKARACIEVLDETHRRLVGYVRVIVDRFMRFSAASRRERLPYLLWLMGRVDVTPEDAGLPAEWARKSARTTTRDLPYRRQQAFLKVVENMMAMGPSLDSCPTCLVTA